MGSKCPKNSFLNFGSKFTEYESGVEGKNVSKQTRGRFDSNFTLVIHEVFAQITWIEDIIMHWDTILLTGNQ